jgi:hypothetical protein
LKMLDFLVGWVKSTKFELLIAKLVSLTNYARIAESLNPTPNCQVGFHH